MVHIQVVRVVSVRHFVLIVVILPLALVIVVRERVLQPLGRRLVLLRAVAVVKFTYNSAFVAAPCTLLAERRKIRLD